MHPQTEFLLNHSATASTFASTTGQAFVSLPLGPFSHQVCSVLSPRFRDWLIDAFYREHNEPPSDYALRQTIRAIEARALSNAPRLAVHRRIAARGHPRHPDAILLDLGNADGEIVEITPDGWQITTDPTAAFLHSRGNVELPHPIAPAHDCILPPALNFATDADRTRLTVWLLSALNPTGPHPILVLDGPPACGKSTAARMLRALIDPSAAPVLALTGSAQELLAVAQHNWILAFDHTGPIRPRLSDALCRLATGAALFHRDTGDPREPLPVELHRPILITTTAGWNPDQALASRAITVRLAPLTAATRRTESDLWTEFEFSRPQILAALCQATSAALAHYDATRLHSTPLHADAAHWATAALPDQAQSIVNALNEIPATPIIDSIAAFVENQATWTGTATDLLHEISVTSVTAAVTANALSHHLRCHKNLLESKNIQLTFTRRHGGSRLIVLTITHSLPTTHNPPPTTSGAPRRPPTTHLLPPTNQRRIAPLQ
jgi:hypothetical protein